MASPVVSLRGKVALITGATSGIGQAAAVLFNKLGASIIITGRAKDRLHALAEELSNSDSETFPFAADLTEDADIKSLVEAVIGKFNRLDILVNSAGIIEKGTIENTSLEQFDHIINVNLRAVFYLTHLLTPYLIASKGSIVNVSSVNGMRSFPGVLSYNISKAGVDQLTRCAALELASKGVRVNSVNPGVTKTNLHLRSGMEDAAYAAFLEHSKQTHALGRVGTPEEVANAIAFLASDAASFITGVSLPVDGGRHAMCPRHEKVEDGSENSLRPNDEFDDDLFADKMHAFTSQSPAYQPSSSLAEQPVCQPTRLSRRYPLRATVPRRCYSPDLPASAGSNIEEEPLPQLDPVLVRRSLNGKKPPIVLMPRKRSYKKDDLTTDSKPPLWLRSAVDLPDRVSLLRHIEEQDKIIALMTSSPVFRAKFIGSITELPLALLMQQGPLDVPVCSSVPKLELLGAAVNLAFVVDTTKIDMAELNYDDLGPWNLRGGCRLSMTKFFFNKDRVKCSPGEHEFCVQRKAYVHPHCVPPNSVKKILWIVTKRNRFCRYAIITYEIGENALIDANGLQRYAAPRGTWKTKQVKGQRTSSSRVHSSRLRPVSSLRLTSPQKSSDEDMEICYEDAYGSDGYRSDIIDHGTLNQAQIPLRVFPPLDERHLAHMTNAPIYKQNFINLINDVPLDILLRDSLDESIPVSTFVPGINLLGVGAALSFIVDTNRVPVVDLSSDNLGQWNARDGRRMNVRKFYYKEKSKCSEGEHDFLVVRRKYVHPYCEPPGALRKNIWLIQKGNVYCRYALISYHIGEDAEVPLLPHGNTRFSHAPCMKRCPSEVKAKNQSRIKLEEDRDSVGTRIEDPVALAFSGAEVNVVDATASDNEGSEVNVAAPPSQQEKPISLCNMDDAISKEEMAQRIAQCAPGSSPYSLTFIQSVTDVPVDLLRSREITEDIAPVNKVAPVIRLTGITVQMSFIVDTAQEWSSVLGSDNLGAWNVKDGKRMSVLKFYFNKNDERCAEGEHNYFVVRRRYIHPYATPEGSVRKIVWQIRRPNQSYFRYSLITYSIMGGASINFVEARPSKDIAYHSFPPVEPPDERAYDEEISRITSSPVFLKKYVNAISELPVELMLHEWELEQPVCVSVPNMNILREPTRMALQMTFIVDTSKVCQEDLSTDNLGQWNVSNGRRMTMRKFYFDRSKARCLEGSHYYVATRKTYVHPNSIPDGAVRKIIWQIRSVEGDYARYAVITYDIRSNTVVEAVPHGNSKANTEVYQRKEPSLIAEYRARKRLQKMKRNGKRYLMATEDDCIILTKQHMIDRSVVSPSEITMFEDTAQVEEVETYQLTPEEIITRMSLPSLRQFTRPYHNNEPFVVLFAFEQNLSPSQCVSCGIDFSRQPLPPEDLVLQHVERFWNQKTGSYSSQQMHKRYVHARLDCVLNRYGYFTTADFLLIPEDVRIRLTESHQRYLSEQFGVSFF